MTAAMAHQAIPDLKGFGANGRVFFWLRLGTPSLQTVHVGFVADSEIMVKQAYAEAIAAGAAEIHSQQIIVDPMLTSELRYGDLWSMREFNHFDFELNGIIRALLRTAVNDFMDSVHHIWCPLSSQEFQDLPDGAETTLTTKNRDGKRDPEMHQTKKGNQYCFGMKAHIGVDDESGLVHSVVGTAATVADVTRSTSCCTATRTSSAPMPTTPASKSAPSMPTEK